MGAISMHHVRGNFHVVEHPLQLLGELVSTFHFQLGKHAPFCIVRYRSVLKKAFGKVALVIPFKHVLVCKEPEDCYGLIQHSVDLGIVFLGGNKNGRIDQNASLVDSPL
jgi:hypothetical protein